MKDENGDELSFGQLGVGNFETRTVRLTWVFQMIGGTCGYQVMRHIWFEKKGYAIGLT